MAVSLPTLEIDNFVAERQKTRTLSWESDFEKNHKTFAETIAYGIARQAIEELGNTIKDPYKRPITYKNKFISNISLEITESRTARKIMSLAAGSEEIPPFAEWLAKFSLEQQQLDHYEARARGVDREYFEELMAMVGRVAEKKLNEILSAFRADPAHKDLQFKVEWYRKSDQQFSNPSDFRDNCLRIELWFNEKPIPQELAEKNSAIIEQHRVKQRELQKIRVRNSAIMGVIIGVALISIMIFLASHQSKFRELQRSHGD